MHIFHKFWDQTPRGNMNVEGTKPVVVAVDEHLIHEIGSADIDNVKTTLVSVVKEDKLYKIHSVSDLINYFRHSGLHYFIIIEAIKDLVRQLNREDLVQYLEAYEYLLKKLAGINSTDNFHCVYEKIAVVVQAGIGGKNADALKEEYADVIDSIRDLHSIRTVKDLLSILEDRDVLNSYDVNVLEDILEKLKENNLKKLVFSYKTLFGSSSQCEICGCEDSYINSKKNTANPVDKPECDELDTSVSYLCENLGPRWKKLACTLKINEGKITSIQKDCISDTEEQITQMFKLWRKTSNEASVANLVCALRKCNLAYFANEIENKTYRNF